jgi:uncharacterized membrane protein YGL010W
MKSFIEQAQFYSHYHESKATLYTHLIGVPLIVFSMMILLGFVQLIIPNVLSTTLACLGTLVLIAYYLRLNWRLGLCLLPILALMLWVSSLISHQGPTRASLWTFFFVFVVGWVVQLTGHLVEGKKPAFMDSMTQALVAPLYLAAEVGFMLGRMPELRKQIHPDEIDKSQD